MGFRGLAPHPPTPLASRQCTRLLGHNGGGFRAFWPHPGFSMKFCAMSATLWRRRWVIPWPPLAQQKYYSDKRRPTIVSSVSELTLGCRWQAMFGNETSPSFDSAMFARPHCLQSRGLPLHGHCVVASVIFSLQHASWAERPNADLCTNSIMPEVRSRISRLPSFDVRPWQVPWSVFQLRHL